MAGRMSAELCGTHSLASQGSRSGGGMILLQCDQHDSRKGEAPCEGHGRSKGDVNLLEEALLSLDLKAHIGLKCYHVPIEGSFDTNLRLSRNEWP